jgi:integrase
MPRKRLTEEGVERVKPPPPGKQIDYQDAHCPGLVLRVNYGGAKSWRAQYYVKRAGKDGKQVSIPTTHKLGQHPTLRLKAAREAARQFLTDPQKAKAEAAAGTFEQVAENFLTRHVKAKGLRSARDYERLINKLVLPHWRDRPFEAIRRSDVANLLDIIETECGPRQADKVLAIVRKMMAWYATRSDTYSTPVVRGMHRHGQHKRDRWLNDDEIRALWAACAGLGTLGALVKVLLVTGQRRDKVTKMKWSDLADGVWVIPRETREKHAPERLHLPQLVLDIINVQPRIVGNPHVFAASRSGGPFNGFRRRAELDDAMPEGTAHWQIHDLRRTARKLMTRAGVRVDVGELALGHSIKGIRAHYDDPGEYQPMIDAAVQSVANEVERILNPPGDNIVSMQTRHRVRAG